MPVLEEVRLTAGTGPARQSEEAHSPGVGLQATEKISKRNPLA